MSQIESVRILAVRADEPYAKPGDMVNIELLAADGRRDKTVPMAVSWVPAPCINPEADAYYNCYSWFAAMFPRGADLTPQLVGGATVFRARVRPSQ